MALNFSGNQVLFGWNPTEGIVALELEDDRHIRLYRRVQGQLLSELQEFRPIIWLQEFDLLRNFKGEVEIAELGGELVYRALAVFKSWKADGWGRSERDSLRTCPKASSQLLWKDIS